MKSNLNNEEKLVGYLLGELSEAEQLRLEELFFTDDELFEQLTALEAELRYDYAQGKLSPHQRERFEKRFINTPAARRQVEQAGAILTTLNSIKAETAGSPAVLERKRPSLRQTLAAFFTTQGASWRLALTMAALLLVAISTWFIYQTIALRNQLEQVQAQRTSDEEQQRKLRGEEQARIAELHTDLERERAERERLEQELAKKQGQITEPQNPNRSFIPTLLSFVLSPGGVRGADGAQKKLAIPKGTKTIQLELALKNKGDYRSFRAQLLTAEGAEVWRQDRLRASGRRVVLTLPAHRLADGDYELALKGLAPTREYEEAGSYYFTIVKK